MTKRSPWSRFPNVTEQDKHLTTMPHRDWVPAQEDWDTYRDDVTKRLTVLVKDERAVLPLREHEPLCPLWLWRMALTQPSTFGNEFYAHLVAWCREVHPYDPLSPGSIPKFKTFCIHLYRRWKWYYLHLVAATAGLPQPQRRRMRLSDLSTLQQQAIRLPVTVTTPHGLRLGRPEDVARPE